MKLMKNILLITLVLCAAAANAQFYYTDVLGTKQTNQLNKLMQANSLKKVTGKSFESNNEVSEGFLLEQTISNNGQKVVTKSGTVKTGISYFTSVLQGGRLAKTTDSSMNAIVNSEYAYDSKGNLTSLSSVSKDFDGLFSSTEKHLWTYNSNNVPEKMLKIKNETDTTIVSFVLDGEANVAEEIWKKNNRTIETYYYYYNAKKQLTDIVRFNRKANQLLPDFIFEYDSRGRVNQMTQSQHSRANYLIYKISYNEAGFKDKEYLFNKTKEFLGKVEYSYQ